MPLPQVEKPSYKKAELPSSRSINFRPWRVKEEKELMFAIEGSKDEEFVAEQIVELIKKCSEKPEMVEELSEVDLLYLAVQIRRVSKGDESEVTFTCPECGHRVGKDFPITIDLTKDVHVKPFDTRPIEADGYTFHFRDLSVKERKRLAEKYKTKTEQAYETFLSSIKSVASETETFAHFTREELVEFVDALEPNTFKKIVKDRSAKDSEFSIQKEFECEVCKTKSNVYIKSVTDFFV